MIGLEGAARNAALIPQIQEIGANLLLAEQIGRAHVVGREPADRLDVDVPVRSAKPASRMSSIIR